MFMGHQDTMFLDVFIHLGNHYVLHHLGADAGEGDGPVVFCFAFAALLEHRGIIGGFPVNWAVTLIIRQNICQDGGNRGTEVSEQVRAEVVRPSRLVGLVAKKFQYSILTNSELRHGWGSVANAEDS